jgi:thiol-disulfide isomerase/thioredoxin
MKKWASLAVLAGLVLGLPTAFAATADVRAFERGSWQEIRKAHAGEPVVVHFWGLTCGPCRGEMPEWGKFFKQHTDLHLVMVDADLVPNERDAVRAVLVQSGLLAAENWMFNDDFVERLHYEIDPHWQGEIPLTLLIAPDGTTTKLEGVADFAKVSAWLDAQAAKRK